MSCRWETSELHQNTPSLWQHSNNTALQIQHEIELYAPYCSKTHPIHTKFLDMAEPDETEKYRVNFLESGAFFLIRNWTELHGEQNL